MIRILLLADSHIGFDLPARPRIERRRRGHDFAANFKRSLLPAMNGEVDLVVHGGDLFYRSKLTPYIIEMGLRPLVEVAEMGTPVYVVPGNHERSQIPGHLWAAHPNLHIFHKPSIFKWEGVDRSLALGGFPFQRRIRESFSQLVQQTGILESDADIRLLCIHQTVEGAQVGPQNFTFSSGDDVICGSDIPQGLDAILAGHIHRSQVISNDLAGRPLAAPVIYPGSIERTSFAERLEEKHCVKLIFDSQSIQSSISIEFLPLPTRPMRVIKIDSSGLSCSQVISLVRRRLKALAPDSIVRIKVEGELTAETRDALSAASLRNLAPTTMNISLAHR